MSKVIYIKCLDDPGFDPIDLHQCRMYILATPDEGDVLSTLYRTPKGVWIEHYGFQDYPDRDSPSGWHEGYREVDQIGATTLFLQHDAVIPKELHTYIAQADPDHHWTPRLPSPRVGSSGEPTSARPPGEAPRPWWDAETRRLWFGDILCREYTRHASFQIMIIEAFEAQGWPHSIASPWNVKSKKLTDAVAAINRDLEPTSPICFAVADHCPRWNKRRQAV
jgi:hypothetical protein